MAGIVLSSTNESMQEDLFFPTDPRLFAVNVNGEPNCGTLVFDLNSKNEPDQDRGARLQSAFRVIKKPLGLDNAIAFQIGPSGKHDTGGGWFTDIPDGLCADNQIAIAQGSWVSLGCLHVGHLNDKHQIGKDNDGNQINPLHVYMLANFYRSFDEDGPLNVGVYQPPGPDQQIKVPVHFGFNHALQVWDWWSTSFFYQPPGQAEIHPGVTGDDPLLPKQGPPGIAAVGKIGSDSLNGIVNMVATLGALTAAAMVVRPENYAAGSISSGVFSDPSLSSGGGEGLGQGDPFGLGAGEGLGGPVGAGMGPDWSSSVTSAMKAKADNGPVSGMESGYGAQGGNIPGAGGSGAGTNLGGEGDPWVHTTLPYGVNDSAKPSSRRWRGGTCNGGICFHPPETDLRDVQSNGMAPPGITLSTVMRVFAAGAYIGFGTPELVNGGIKEGVIAGTRSATGDLDFKAVTASGTPTTLMTLTKSAHTIQWYAAGNFYGELTCNNAANRLYTFPDKSGTVAMIADIGGGGFVNLFQATADGSVSGIATNVSVVGAGVGSQNLGANKLIIGSIIRINAKGYYSTQVVPGKLRIGIVIGGSVVVNTALQSLPSSMANQYWEINDLMLTVRTTGGGGTLQAHGSFLHMETAGAIGGPTLWEMFLTGTAAVDTTAINLIDIVATFDTASNSIFCTQCLIEHVG